MKTYVIAGTYHEAQVWIKQDLDKIHSSKPSMKSMSDYVYISKAEDLIGIKDPHGVFVGNWMGRPDIYEIVQRLMINSINPNPALGKIYKDLTPKVRPTPKKPSLTKEFFQNLNGGLINR